MAANAHSSALIVLANDGYDLGHASAVYSELRRTGFTVMFATARKGDCLADVRGDDVMEDGAETKAAHSPERSDDAARRVGEAAQSALPLSTFKPSNFAAVLFCGGSGCAAAAYGGSEDVQRAVRKFWEAGKVCASVGGGALAFEHVTLSSGKDFLIGKTVAAPSAQEEEDVAEASPSRSSFGSDAGSESSDSMSEGSRSAASSESADGG